MKQHNNSSTTALALFFGMACAAPAAVLFQDDFNDNSLDPAKWSSAGNYVSESDGILKLVVNQTDNGGSVTSASIPLDSPTGLITMTRRVQVHQNYGTGTRYLRGRHEMFSASSQRLVRISYYDYHYNGDFVGFGKVGGYTPVYDTWFDETMTYDPVTGASTYQINSGTPIALSGTPLPSGDNSIYLSWYDVSWYTGHYVYVDDVLVTQGAPVPEPSVFLPMAFAMIGLASFQRRRRIPNA